MKSSARVGLIGAVVSTVVAIGVAVAAASDAPSSQSPPLINGAAPASSPTIAPSALASFGVLRSGRTGTDALSASPATGGDSPIAAAGADLSQARLTTTVRNWGVWLVPGANVLCLYSADLSGAGGGSACPYASHAVDGFLFTLVGGPDGATGIPANELLLTGVVPDGVPSVLLHMGDGSTRTLTTTRNGFAALVPDTAKTVTYTDANGPQERLVPSCGAC
jgi:hypothetical protein